MLRREFMTGLGSAMAWPLHVGAQERRMPMVGILHAGLRNESDQWRLAFLQGLRELGFVEGQNVSIEYRYADNQMQRLSSGMARMSSRRL
jgi:putative ABC transport system substrate-binding protein